MNNNSINEDIFECKMYITDLKTKQKSKEIDMQDLIYKDNIEFEFGNYEDEDYSSLPYKDFKFFLNDYSVTIYSSQYHNAMKEIDRLNNIINELINFLQEKWEYPGARIYIGEIIGKLDELGLEYKLKELKGSGKE